MQARRSLDTFLSRRFGSFPKCPKAALTSRPYRPLHKPAAISTTRVASTCESQQCGAQCNLEASPGDDHARSVGARSYCHAPDDLGNRCRHYTCVGPPRRKLFKHGVQHAIVLHGRCLRERQSITTQGLEMLFESFRCGDQRHTLQTAGEQPPCAFANTRMKSMINALIALATPPKPDC